MVWSLLEPLKLTDSMTPPGTHYWHLNETILSNPVHCIMLEKDIWEYISINDTVDISPCSLWSAHKAVIRGKIIQLSSRLKCKRQSEVLKLEKEFKEFSSSHKQNPTPTTLTNLESTRLALNLALTSSAEKHRRWISGRHYMQADKFGPQLAAKLTPKNRIFALPKIKSLTGSLTQNPKEMLSVLLFQPILWRQP